MKIDEVAINYIQLSVLLVGFFSANTNMIKEQWSQIRPQIMLVCVCVYVTEAQTMLSDISNLIRNSKRYFFDSCCSNLREFASWNKQQTLSSRIKNVFTIYATKYHTATWWPLLPRLPLLQSKQEALSSFNWFFKESLGHMKIFCQMKWETATVSS